MEFHRSRENGSSQGIREEPDKLYEQIRGLIAKGSKREAIGGLQMLLTLHPDYAIAHNDLGVLYYKEGEKGKALDHYKEAARMEPENPTFQKNLADFYCVESGALEEGLRIYLKVLEANPTDIEVLLALGNVCALLEKAEDAKVFFNRVLELEPWNMDARTKLNEIEKGQMSEVSDPGSAVEDQTVDDVPFEYPKETRFNGAGGSDVGSQRSENGGQTTEWHEVSAEEAYERAQSLVNENREADAIRELQRLIEIWPDHALAHNDLGVLYYRSGEKGKAQRHYEQAALLVPENATFQKNLADFYCVEMGELEAGLKIYLRVLEANPTDVETLLILGDICAAIEKNEDAKVFYNRVLELEPWNLNAQEKLDALPGEGLTF
jgi:Flp pilus assembly protein TadD